MRFIKREYLGCSRSYQMAFELNPESSAAIKGMKMCFRSLKKSGNLKKKVQKPKTVF
jgi:hypothetical protein